MADGSSSDMTLADETALNVKASANWLIFGGILTILMGIFCIASPGITGLTVAILVGILMIVSGIFAVIDGIQLKKGTEGRGWMIFVGIVAVIGGGMMVGQPLKGLAALTMVVAIFFFATGLLRIMASLELKPAKGWGWVLVGGICSVILGGLLLAKWPWSGWQAIGTLVGVYLLFAGWARVFLGLAGRQATNELKDAASA